jgi:hypothetical protein
MSITGAPGGVDAGRHSVATSPPGCSVRWASSRRSWARVSGEGQWVQTSLLQAQIMLDFRPRAG